jgi:hypothetical protein
MVFSAATDDGVKKTNRFRESALMLYADQVNFDWEGIRSLDFLLAERSQID